MSTHNIGFYEEINKIISLIITNYHQIHISSVLLISLFGAAPVAEWVRSLYFSALNLSIISPLCLVKVRAPHWPHVRQAKFCLRVCQVVFPGYSRFASPTDWLVSMSEIILKGKLN